VGLAAPRSVKSKFCLEPAHLHVKRSWLHLLWSNVPSWRGGLLFLCVLLQVPALLY
jgi:hypothetical protein